MKDLLIVGMILGVTVVSTMFAASGDHGVQKGCEKKITHLEQELVKAHIMQNDHRVHGLEISLSNVKTHCTDEGLVQKVEAKIDDTREDLQEHTEDLAEAMADGRVDKIEKYQVKIEEETKELEELDRELKALS